MKLVQLNIWQGRLVRHVTRFLEAEDPDIVCLQEVYRSEHTVPTWDAFSSLELIQEVLPGRHTFFAPLYSFEVAGRKVVFGNAIISRFPIHNKQHDFTNGHYIDNLAVEDLVPNTRNFQWCELELPDGERLSLINHHAYWDREPLGSHVSTEKMRKVKRIADSLPYPLILTGDMNVTPESEAMQLFEGTLTNLTKKYQLPTTLSAMARAFNNGNKVPCDNTLVSPDVQVRSFTASETLVSDHKPLILEFDV